MSHTLSDKEVLSLLLMQQKHLAEEYNSTACHVDDPQLLQTLTDIIAEEQRTRLQIYQAMHQRGWYNPRSIDQSQVNQSRQNFQQTRHRLQNAVSQAARQAGSHEFSWSQSQPPQTTFQPGYQSQPGGTYQQPAGTTPPYQYTGTFQSSQSHQSQPDYSSST